MNKPLMEIVIEEWLPGQMAPLIARMKSDPKTVDYKREKEALVMRSECCYRWILAGNRWQDFPAA